MVAAEYYSSAHIPSSAGQEFTIDTYRDRKCFNNSDMTFKEIGLKYVALVHDGIHHRFNGNA